MNDIEVGSLKDLAYGACNLNTFFLATTPLSKELDKTFFCSKPFFVNHGENYVSYNSCDGTVTWRNFFDASGVARLSEGEFLDSNACNHYKSVRVSAGSKENDFKVEYLKFDRIGDIYYRENGIEIVKDDDYASLNTIYQCNDRNKILGVESNAFFSNGVVKEKEVLFSKRDSVLENLNPITNDIFATRNVLLDDNKTSQDYTFNGLPVYPNQSIFVNSDLVKQMQTGTIDFSLTLEEE